MKKKFAWFLLLMLAFTNVEAQEDTPVIPLGIPAQNLLKFNRFLINPTFSTVREDKSYLNLYHRNQNRKFRDGKEIYLLSYSGRIGDRSGLGLSLYSEKYGTFSNFGVMANYAYGLKISEKSNFTFGFNVTYYNSGFDNNASNVDLNIDPVLRDLDGSSLLAVQPGFNISYGDFDFGMYAENLFDYNLDTSESLTEFNEKTYSGHLQFTKRFKNSSGLLEQARLLSLARGVKRGDDGFGYGASMVLDAPKIGWLQAGYDDFYGASAGVGFNIKKRISIGYTMEKAISGSLSNLGPTHEISFAYSFQPNLTEDRVMLDDEKDAVAEAQEEFFEADALVAEQEEEIKRLKAALKENDEILAEVIFRQDSLERSREQDLERRFAQVLQMMQNPDAAAKEAARKIMFTPNNVKSDKEIVENNFKKNDATLTKESKPKDNGSVSATKVKDNVDAVANVKKNTASPKIDFKKPLVKKSSIAIKKQPVKSKDVVAFEKVAKNSKIRNQRAINLKGVDGGYYIIANVYKGTHYLNKFVDGLNEKGLDATYFKNPKNGLKYVYLKRYDNWEDAVAAYKSNVEGTYTDDIWIMNVDNSANEEYVSSNNSKYDDNLLQKNVLSSSKTKKSSIFDNAKKSAAIKTSKTYASSKKPALRKPIEKAKIMSVKGLDKGYYIVANVFSVKRNADSFVKNLNKKGLEAKYFTNPENMLNYVYLMKHNSWNGALTSYYSNLNDSYFQDIWIMRVNPNLLL